jgi:hypothetical protein
MKRITIRSKSWPSVLGALLCICVALSSVAQADEVTMQTLIERAKIQDLITRYYYNFGNSAESFANFYTDDGELILIGQSYKGKKEIAKAYTFPSGTAQCNYYRARRYRQSTTGLDRERR